MSLQALTHEDFEVNAIKRADEFTGYQIFLLIKEHDFQFSVRWLQPTLFRLVLNTSFVSEAYAIYVVKRFHQFQLISEFAQL